MEGFELLKLEDFTDFVEKSNVEAGYAWVFYRLQTVEWIQLGYLKK